MSGCQSRPTDGGVAVALALAGASFLFGGTGLAQSSESGAARPPLVVWYHGTETCPAGADFLRLLAKRDTSARLASVGDRIDFVVTLGLENDRHAGRLERQTERGTIAIREVQATECAEVAEALALSLALAAETRADQGTSGTPPATEPAASTGVDAGAGEQRPSTAEPGARLPQSVAAQSVGDDATEPSLAKPEKPRAEAGSDQVGDREVTRSRWAIEGGGTLFSGAAPSPLLGFSVSAQWRDLGGRTPGPTVRLGLVRASGSEPTTRESVDSRLLVGSIEVCPVRFASGVLYSSPCAAFALGGLTMAGTGETGVSESVFWASPAAVGLVGWSAAQFLVELRTGLHLPLARHSVEFERPTVVLHETSPLVVQAEIVLGVQIP